MTSRRQFFKLAGMGATGAFLAAPLKAFYAKEAAVRSKQARQLLLDEVGYGALQPDPRGILDLPVGFRYRIVSQAGDRMADDHLVPGAFDGMAAFNDTAGNVVLIRNHELSPDADSGVIAPLNQRYDSQAKGGTTTLVLGRDRTLIRQYASLAGTCRNCAGGATPWGSWISCEEDTSTPVELGTGLVTKPHGYNFEVPIMATAPIEPEPLVAMGRFRHEAIAVDPRTGNIYQTEDQTDGLFYRFRPNQPNQLKAGGILEALQIVDRPQAITRANFPIGEPMAATWIQLDEVDPAEDTLRLEGFGKGAAQFSRGEGICYHDGAIYFTCTNGGNVPHGQVWRYRPEIDAATKTEIGGAIELLLQPDNPKILDFPDNLVMAPSGDLLLCEDGNGEQFIVGLTPDGQLYPFARNALNNAEFAGICFAPDGQTLFVNLYHPGLTLAIWAEPSS
jgi:uncharacterized protein